MTEANSTLSQDLLKELLRYDLETGVFVWRVKRSNNVKIGDVAGCVRSDGYLHIGINSKLYQAHRLAWLYITGDWPIDQIDHIDGDPGNNRFDNLRVCNSQENSRNKKMPITNTSGVIGVSWNKRNKKWVALIMRGGKNIYLGCFDDLDEAAKARKQAEIEYGFHPNHGRV